MKRFLTLLTAIFTLQAHAEKLPDNFFFHTLDNGLQVLVIEDNSVPLATIEICVRNGSYCEDTAYNGLSHLYEHMFFKANKDLPSQEAFMDKVNELGITFNGTTSNERVNYFITLSSLKLDDGLKFMNSAIRYPLFLAEEMKKENPVVDGEFQRNESNPFFFLNDEMAHQLWGADYSRKNVIGDHEIILTATPEKMRVIQEKYYYPNNSIIVIAGNVQHEEVFQKVKAIYNDWTPATFDPFSKWPIPEFKPLEKNNFFLVKNENAQVPIFMIGLHGPDTRKDIKATYAADVFSFILQQASSKLQQELVDKGLALQVNVSYQTCKYTGPINIILVPHPAKVKEAFEALEKQIAQWDSADYFTDEQLQTAKNLLAIDDAYGKESTSDFVHTVTYWWASASIDYYTNYVKNLQAVTRDDIRHYVQTYIMGQPSATGLLLPTQMAEGMGVHDLKTFLNK